MGDVEHLWSAEDIAGERLRLMSWREHMEATCGGRGFRRWRVVAASTEGAITERAVELGLETRE